MAVDAVGGQLFSVPKFPVSRKFAGNFQIFASLLGAFLPSAPVVMSFVLTATDIRAGKRTGKEQGRCRECHKRNRECVSAKNAGAEALSSRYALSLLSPTENCTTVPMIE